MRDILHLGFRVPLRAEGSFSFTDPDVIYGTVSANALTISKSFRRPYTPEHSGFFDLVPLRGFSSWTGTSALAAALLPRLNSLNITRDLIQVRKVVTGHQS